MPIYTYECPKCQYREERMHPVKNLGLNQFQCRACAYRHKGSIAMVPIKPVEV